MFCWGSGELGECGPGGESFANRGCGVAELAVCEEIGVWAVFRICGINELRRRFRKPRGLAEGA